MPNIGILGLKSVLQCAGVSCFFLKKIRKGKKKNRFALDLVFLSKMTLDG
jgi:hypothetical protein